jgi:outer membrane immunogenic protein
MITRLILAIGAFCCVGGMAAAEESTASNLPSLALNPPVLNPAANAPAVSPWSGLYVGSEIFASAFKGAKGGFGGAGLIGYNHEFSNNLVLGVEAAAGYSPNLLPYRSVPGFPYRSVLGYDFAATNFKLGYDMGRFMPFVTAGVTFAKPNSFSSSFLTATDSVNNLLGSPSNMRTFGTVGAGFDYALTNNLTVGVAVSANKGHGFPPWP